MSAEVSDAIAGSAPILPRRSILIVEDELILAKDLQHTLIELGYDAYAIASSAEAAMCRAAESRLDVVLMDIRIKARTMEFRRRAFLESSFPLQSST